MNFIEIESDLKFEFRDVVDVIKFDVSTTHQLSHCSLKAVDFIVESKKAYYFIEIKDPDDPNAQNHQARTEFSEDFQKKKIHRQLITKYRDSFIYRWATKDIDKPIIYVVLLCWNGLDDQGLQIQQEYLRKNLPIGTPKDVWKREIVKDCVLLNLRTWNQIFTDWPVFRISEQGKP